jgi:hypothetical protein
MLFRFRVDANDPSILAVISLTCINMVRQKIISHFFNKITLMNTTPVRFGLFRLA